VQIVYLTKQLGYEKRNPIICVAFVLLTICLFNRKKHLPFFRLQRFPSCCNLIGLYGALRYFDAQSFFRYARKSTATCNRHLHCQTADMIEHRTTGKRPILCICPAGRECNSIPPLLHLALALSRAYLPPVSRLRPFASHHYTFAITHLLMRFFIQKICISPNFFVSLYPFSENLHPPHEAIAFPLHGA